MRQAEKTGGRWQIPYDAPDATEASGTRLTFTRRGVEVTGWFDHMCATGNGWSLTWEALDEIREALNQPRRRGQ